MRVPWELLLILALLVIVAVVAQQAAPQAVEPPADLVSDSAAPSGSRALYLWLQAVGYRVERWEYRQFRPDETINVLLVMAPSLRPNKGDLIALRRWVERGGTLIAVGGMPPRGTKLPLDNFTPGADALLAFLSEFGLQLRPFEDLKAEAAPGQPLLLRPPVGKTRVDATGYITGTANLVPYLGEPERPVAAGLAVGKGQVFVLASNYAFSNQGLGESDNAALLLNWLPAPREAGAIAFDEFHHGRIEARSLSYVLVHERWGWAVLYALGIIFLYLLLDGRRFGRPVPSVVDTRRAAAEYVVSVAGLLRRGSKREWVARHYERALRRQLAAACGLDPTADTPTVAARASEVDQVVTGMEGRNASRTLLQLRDAGSNGISEGGLVRLVAETDRVIKACGRRRE